MIGDSKKASGRAVVTCEHEGGANCSMPDPLRYRSRGARGGGGKQATNPPPTNGKGKGAPEKGAGGRGTPFNMWTGVQRKTASLKRRADDQEAELDAEAEAGPRAKAGPSSDKSMSEAGGEL
jgi:hypothetical protein